jgi:lysophospholipase L1-like esterase
MLAFRAVTSENPLLGKTSAALCVMLAVLALPYASPRLRALRVVRAPWDKAPAPEAQPGGDFVPQQSLSVGEQALGAAKNEGTVTNALPATSTDQEKQELDPAVLAKLAGSLAVEDPTGHALDAFYGALAKTIRHEATTRVLHYGDSVIASDLISGTMRRLMQSKFGDAGHGFILVANPWQWYFHNDVTHYNSEGWEANKLAGPIALDGMYGLGGVSFTSYGGGLAFFGTATTGSFGRKVSRFDLYYLEQPRGGDLEIKVKDGPTETLSTRASADAKTSKIHSVKVPDGEAAIKIRAMGGGPVRLFGVSLERDVPGVTYDALGAHAAMAVYWKQEDPQNWKDQMALRQPSLVILQYGTNESELWKIDWDEYQANLGIVFDKVKEAAEGASILVMAPLDRAERGPGGELVTKPVILKLREAQHAVALAKGIAFWDTFAAMGGEGSMARWYKAEPQLAGGDLTHPTPAGGDVLGNLLLNALTSGYTAWAHAHPEAPPLP